MVDADNSSLQADSMSWFEGQFERCLVLILD